MYDAIAHYYDLTHAQLDDDIPLALKLAHEADGPVLELGCGSGRLLLPLARITPVIGVDSSAAMLARARQKLRALPSHQADNVTLLEADMAAFRLPEWAAGNVGLALVSYNTFMHLDTAQAMATLAQIRGSLANNGRLFIDLANPFVVAATPEDTAVTLEQIVTDPENGQQVLQFASNRLDAGGQTLYVTWIFDAAPPQGGPVSRTVAQMQYHYRFPHQLELLLQEAGLRLEQTAGDYDLSPFDENSERLLLLARGR